MDGLIDLLIFIIHKVNIYHAGIVNSSILYQLDKNYLLCSHLLDSL